MYPPVGSAPQFLIGQYKSTLVSPACEIISVTFDPFMHLSLPLQSATTRKMSVTVFSCDGSVVPVTCTVTVLKQGRVKDFIQAVSNACALKQNEKVFIVEVKVLDKENSMLEKENRRLTKLLHKERHLNDSGGKHNSASLKSNKWKSGPRDCSPIKKKIDFIKSGSPRNTLSPLRQNTPESRMHKK
ncbi:ubiquitin carboxyl-terminal hydrolase 5 [Tanacetum coccineum]